MNAMSIDRKHSVFRLHALRVGGVMKVVISIVAVLGIDIFSDMSSSSAFAATEAKCSISRQIFDVDNMALKTPFLGGTLPDIVGFVTQEQKKFTPLLTKSPPLKALHNQLSQLHEELGYGLKKTPKQKYQVYVAYRRASNDISGTPFVLFECPQAKNFIFDFLQEGDPTGIFTEFRSLIEGNIRGFGRGRFAIEGVVKYKLEFWAKDDSLTSKAPDYLDKSSDNPGKMKVPHPAAPKQLVLQALFTPGGHSAGLYDFTLTADVELKCIGPFLICEATTISSFISKLKKLASGNIEELAAKKILGYINDKTGDITNLDKTLRKIRDKTMSNIYRNRYATTPRQAVVEFKNALIPVTVPDVTKKHKCTAIKPLKRRGFRLSVETVETKNDLNNDYIERTEPEKFEDVTPGSPITLYIWDANSDRKYRCKNIKATFEAVKKGL